MTGWVERSETHQWMAAHMMGFWVSAIGGDGIMVSVCVRNDGFRSALPILQGLQGA